MYNIFVELIITYSIINIFLKHLYNELIINESISKFNIVPGGGVKVSGVSARPAHFLGIRTK